MYKICNRCYIELSIDNFHKNNGGKFGVKSICKKCTEYTYIKKGRRCNPEFDMKNYQREYQKRYREENKEILAEKKKQNYIENKNHYLEYNKEYNKKRRINDPLFKISGNIRNLIKNSFKRQFTFKSKKTIQILGCDFIFFSNYIENLFDEFMNWENYGMYWEIDHIEPVSIATTIEDIVKLNHYSNLRPLKKEENRSKGNKF